MTSIAIIPARGGSKRIPRKNIRAFLGKPIVAYSIEVAINSGLFDEVMVSTDDKEIAEIAKLYGASVPFLRSKDNANDFATTVDVIQEVIEAYRIEKREFDFICCIYPTAPLIQIQRLQEAYHKLIASTYDSVFPIVPFSYPVLRGLELSDNGEVKMIWPEYMNSRSQDLKVAYHDSGSFYWAKQEAFLREGTMICKHGGGIVLSEMEVQDIDNESDWSLAELKYKLLNE